MGERTGTIISKQGLISVVFGRSVKLTWIRFLQVRYLTGEEMKRKFSTLELMVGHLNGWE